MIAFKGRSSMKQYMPLKPVKRGYKAWCLSDSTTGFVTTFDIYTGKAQAADDGYSLGKRVVIGLCGKTALDDWTVVPFDNYFTTVKLVEESCPGENYSLSAQSECSAENFQNQWRRKPS